MPGRLVDSEVERVDSDPRRAPLERAIICGISYGGVVATSLRRELSIADEAPSSSPRRRVPAGI